jgi:hypothetical protein
MIAAVLAAVLAALAIQGIELSGTFAANCPSIAGL